MVPLGHRPRHREAGDGCWLASCRLSPLLALHKVFPEAGPCRYVILDRDSKFDADVRSPGQDGIAQRWVESCQRELEQDRIRDALGKDTPNRRSVENKPCAEAMVVFNALGGLHHRCAWRKAA